MSNAKNLIYILTCLSFSIIIGAAFYEHLAVWPRAFSAIPASLSMNQGEYGLNAEAFWSIIHPITLFLVITTLILFWKSVRRKNILICLIGYIIVLAVTGIYFVPELMDITSTQYTSEINEALTNRGQQWVKLSILRLIFLIGLSLILFLGLSKANTKRIKY